MMVIGANTPAMIKTMTAEVESRNFIVASMRRARQRLRPACRPASRPLALRQPDSLSHYTLDAVIGNAHHHGFAPTTRKKTRRSTKSMSWGWPPHQLYRGNLNKRSSLNEYPTPKM